MRATTIIFRFVQLLGVLGLCVGIANARSFFELLNGLNRGQAWDFAEFAKRLAAFSSPVGIAVALIVGVELILRRGRKAHAQSLQFPGEPWLWKPMWAERRIRLSNRTPWLIGLAALGVFGFVLVPVGLWMASQMPTPTPIYVGLGLTGFLVLALMLMAWLNRRWGRSELEIITLPGVIGGPFRGTVILSEFLPEGTALRVRLNSIRQRTVRLRPSGETNSETDMIWQDEKVLVTDLSMSRPEGVAIPCSFAIPYSCEPTSLDTIGFDTSSNANQDEHVSIHWQLTVGMKDPADLRQVAFEIPVFRTERSSPNYLEDTSVDAPYLEPVDIEKLLSKLPLQIEESESGKRITFSMMRTRDFLFMQLFTLGVIFGVWAIFHYVSMPGAFFAAFLPVVLVIGCFKVLVEELTWKAEIEITAQTLTFTAGFSWSRQRFEFRRRKLPQLECHPEFQRDTGSTYCLRFVPEVGPRCVIAKRLKDKQTATALRDWLMKELWKA
jgi:hypothetical protein